ncbi:MAG: Fe-S cluster assembly ATPase SufC [Candidatus Magasanikbacteria bacterium]|nr:Fe-S cluster assembly ATPase SufC [Candidatus Magasanikbacteria bacterium]
MTQKTMTLQIKNIHISAQDKPIVHGLNLEIKPGEIHAIMGPNGSGKSTLANALMGHPKYTVTKGRIIIDKKDITALSADKRARAGLFLSMQYPPEIPGVSIANFLRLSAGAMRGTNQNPITFHKELNERMKELGIDPSFASRHINLGFSGGERKRLEILQLLILNPTYAILDETDSGLDVDALKVVADGINRFHSSKHGILLITHYNRILKYVVPDFVHIMSGGEIVKSGKKELAKEIEKSGYKNFT